MLEMHDVEYSKAESVHSIQPMHINGFGRLFGGRLMEWIDEIALGLSEDATVGDR